MSVLCLILYRLLESLPSRRSARCDGVTHVVSAKLSVNVAAAVNFARSRGLPGAAAEMFTATRLPCLLEGWTGSENHYTGTDRTIPKPEKYRAPSPFLEHSSVPRCLSTSGGTKRVCIRWAVIWGCLTSQCVAMPVLEFVSRCRPSFAKWFDNV